MPACPQFFQNIGRKLRFNQHGSWPSAVWIKTGLQMRRVDQWPVNRLLRVYAKMDVLQEESQQSLILLTTAGRSQGNRPTIGMCRHGR